MKTPSERGVIGAWAYQARQEAELSVEQVVDLLAERGQAVKPATVRGIESGSKKPGARLLRLLGEVLDSTPPGTPPVVPARDDVLAVAIDRQTAAIEAQAKAFTVLAASIDAAARNVVGAVGRSDQRVVDLMNTLATLRSVAPGATAPRLRRGFRRTRATGTGR